MSTELIEGYKHKIISPARWLEEIANVVDGRKIVMCHGVFDVVHPGHLRHLAYAKSKGDVLVVSLTCDKYVKKGQYRPHVPEGLRSLSLAALDMVDYVIIDENETPLKNIAIIKPDIFAKGFEYSDDLPEATKEEISAVGEYGGEVIFTPGDVVYSSSNLITNHEPDLSKDKAALLLKQFDLSVDDLIKAVKGLSGIKVHVIGDTIIDTYTRTSLIGSNGKTPTFSVLYQSAENYVGGAGIVSQHLRAAGADVTFSTLIGDDEHGKFCVDTLQAADIKVNTLTDEKRPTTNKNAFIAGQYRLLKVDTLDNAPIGPQYVSRLKEFVEVEDADCVVLSDFRHGIFHRNSIEEICSAIPNGALKIADSQVASRWGNITDFKGFDLLTPNEKEARFAIADQDSNIVNLTHGIRNTANTKNVILKLGARGLFFLGDSEYLSLGTFTNKVLDPVGSGDALLAYATLILKKTNSLPAASLVGSVAAACECELDGNIPIPPHAVISKLENLKR